MKKRIIWLVAFLISALLFGAWLNYDSLQRSAHRTLQRIADEEISILTAHDFVTDAGYQHFGLLDSPQLPQILSTFAQIEKIDISLSDSFFAQDRSLYVQFENGDIIHFNIKSPGNFVFSFTGSPYHFFIEAPQLEALIWSEQK